MLEAVKEFTEYLKKVEMEFEYFPPDNGEDFEVVVIGYKGERGNTLNFYFFFDSDGVSVTLRVSDICKVDGEKLMDMYVAVNEINREYPIKLFINEENSVVASEEAVVAAGTAGEECFNIFIRNLAVIEKVYPTLMKALWA